MSSSSATASPRQVVPDVAAFRERQRQRELVPYENVMDEDAPVEAALIVADGWKLGPFPRVKLAAPLAWDELCAQNRSWHFHLQSWDPIATVLAAYDNIPTPAYLGWAVELVVDWARTFHGPEVPSPFAWYDMALGVRTYRLAYLIDVAARSDAVTDEDIAWLLGAADVHRALLLDEESFAAHSNHGFYQAAGQLALGRRLPDLPGMDETFDQGTERFRSLMQRHFSDDGIHLEHSPEYQWIVMQSLAGMIGSGLVSDDWIVDLFDRVQESMAWLVAPNHRVAMFGDSSPREPKIRRLDRLGNQAVRFVGTRGTEGRAPSGTTRLFPSGGYAVLRDRWPEGPDDYADCAYLAQMCSFHSRVHKHADDMSFVWYDLGHEILTDSGRYGYVGQIEPKSELFREGFHYSDPKRVYVESTRAHNAVEIDGRSYARRGVRFYGSGLLDAGDSGGVLYTLCELHHMRSVRHVRILMFRPRDWLIVFDWLRDGTDEAHEFRQWFQFAPELSVRNTESDQLLGESEHGLEVRVAPLLPARLGEHAYGQDEPLLGWISRDIFEFEPRTSACYAGDRGSAQTFATLLALGPDALEPDQKRSRVNISGRNGRLCWNAGGVAHEVSFARDPDQPLNLDYRVRARRP
jgi:hypothetical protein